MLLLAQLWELITESLASTNQTRARLFRGTTGAGEGCT